MVGLPQHLLGSGTTSSRISGARNGRTLVESKPGLNSPADSEAALILLDAA